MIILLLLLMVVLWQFYIGYMRGILLQGFYTLASVISLFIANHFYQKAARVVALWVPFANPNQDTIVHFFKDVDLFELDNVFYAGIAFVAIYSLAYVAFRLVGIFLHLIDLDRFDNVLWNCISGVLAVLVTILFLSMGATLMATVPMNVVQNYLSSHSVIAGFINLPIFAQLWRYFWVTKILKN